jgi:2-dehydro-3-deoxyphosphogluconate aldolase/(4S)-4-hydroxy-2-oxoglutarate aldolase
MTFEQRLRAARVVPVVRTADAGEAVRVVARRRDAGLDVIELTTTIPGWEDVAREIRDDVTLGIGTIRCTDDARRAVAVGADFCVSPKQVPGAWGVLSGIPFLEGGFTPTEVLDSASRGIAKLFPAHLGGPQYLRSLLAVAPDARIMPTGGIAVGEIDEWLDAGAIAIGIGNVEALL